MMDAQLEAQDAADALTVRRFKERLAPGGSLISWQRKRTAQETWEEGLPEQSSLYLPRPSMTAIRRLQAVPSILECRGDKV